MTDVRDLLLPHIRQLKTYDGVDPMEVMAQQAGIPPEKVIRLNGNENPFGPSPEVVKALGSFQHYNHYPDPDQRQLRDVLSEYLGVPAEQIVAGNGSDELIDMILRMFLGQGENIVIPTPTFGMYAFSAEVCGGRVKSVPRNEIFDIDIEATVAAFDEDTKAIFLASPNNPTGNTASEAAIRALLSTGKIVVVDETYYEFCGQSVLPLVDEYSNLVVLRTFSKWAGLAGLRIGLGVMEAGIARTMMSMKSPYNVNLAAEVALIASLNDRPTLLRPGPGNCAGTKAHDRPPGRDSGYPRVAIASQFHPVPPARGPGPGNIRRTVPAGHLPALLQHSAVAGLRPGQCGSARGDGPGGGRSEGTGG